jgi:hypothetical protein
MSALDDLEAAVGEQGERVEERLELLRILREQNGAAQLNERVAEHEQAIREAARKVMESL